MWKTKMKNQRRRWKGRNPCPNFLAHLFYFWMPQECPSSDTQQSLFADWNHCLFVFTHSLSYKLLAELHSSHIMNLTHTSHSLPQISTFSLLSLVNWLYSGRKFVVPVQSYVLILFRMFRVLSINIEWVLWIVILYYFISFPRDRVHRKVHVSIRSDGVASPSFDRLHTTEIRALHYTKRQKSTGRCGACAPNACAVVDACRVDWSSRMFRLQPWSERYHCWKLSVLIKKRANAPIGDNLVCILSGANRSTTRNMRRVQRL